MFLWIMIIVSVFFGYVGYRKSFFTMFATLFNLMFAIFVAVLTTPKLLSFSTGYEDSGYYAGASILLLFILIFGVLQFFAYFYFLKDSEGYFPKLFDKIGAMIFGFLFGYFICALLFLSFSVMPCSNKAASSHICSREQFIQLSEKPMEKVCNFLAWYSLHCFEGNSEKTIRHLLALGDQAPPEDSETGDNEIVVPEVLRDTP